QCANGAVSSFRECGLPYGLRDSLCTLQLCRSVRLHLLHSCNTRYEWLVRPYSAGTLTLQEAPSFAWRTNAAVQLRAHSACIRYIVTARQLQPVVGTRRRKIISRLQLTLGRATVA